ncbi:MAG: hypothetical protein A2Y40_04510 [Candidatus Margulisbacteria bacterium GWF2_35_9]|nr:MAG: hypothetical protein A2Y40_04510 [Candidatus Margulisbacteria bacterium GWF2_35_9]
MGYKEIQLKLPTNYSVDDIRLKIEKKLSIKEYTYSIEHKSLDARKKADIHWVITIGIQSKEIRGSEKESTPSLTIDHKKRNKKALVVGSGPAGYFCALVLQKAGFSTTIIERGPNVEKRSKHILQFESGSTFDPNANYAFGEGGAGTFSDGKLTSRSKHINTEKQFILTHYINAGAPEEIKYLSHPHLGSNNLKVIVKNLRNNFERLGGTILFDTCLIDLEIVNGHVTSAITSTGKIDADVFVVASGHSAFDTYRMLIKNSVQFRTKNFAIGCRIEHLQSLINMAQWGKESLPGVKAAEYRLTFNADGLLPVYTFCMCPGGMVVQASAKENSSIVNGMSNYQRNGLFANAGCVAGINPEELENKAFTPLEALDWLEKLEDRFFEFTNGYQLPACTISDFINMTEPTLSAKCSYPLGLKAAPLWELLPEKISRSLRAGLIDFSKKIKGFDTGLIMGLESKTSSPLQAVREENLLCSGFDNLYIAGEGSGSSGGIISSAADGIKIALTII